MNFCKSLYVFTVLFILYGTTSHVRESFWGASINACSVNVYVCAYPVIPDEENTCDMFKEKWRSLSTKQPSLDYFIHSMAFFNASMVNPWLMKKMKIFSTWPKYFKLYFSETLNFADFKYAFNSSIVILLMRMLSLFVYV